MNAQHLAAYRAFVDAQTTSVDDYLFAEPRCRFTLEPNDELVLVPGAHLQREGAVASVHLPNGARLALTQIPFDKLRLAFAELPCRYSRLVVQLGREAPSFVEQTFSKVMFAPSAIAELEVELPSHELVRFPGSPYELVRAYWRNSLAVRKRWQQGSAPTDAAELRARLLELHELLLTGDARDDAGGRSSFYLPASLLGRKRPTPGSFYDVPTGLERRGPESIITGGARVSVPLLGGDHYWRLLAESVDDEGALADERQLSLDGEPLGQVVRARAEEEGAGDARPWFLPPRPLTDAHFEGLWRALRAAEHAAQAGMGPALLAALAEFHYRFVRVHPLPSANQSLSMNIVNAVLNGASARTGLGGIPHLLLDQLALRFALPAYTQLFTRAVHAWSAPWPNAAQRTRQLVPMTSALNRFVSRLGNAASLVEARALITQEPGETDSGAALSLLMDMAPPKRTW